MGFLEGLFRGKRRLPIVFIGSVSSMGNLTRNITFPYPVYLQEYTVFFALNQQRKLKVSIHIGVAGTKDDENIIRSDKTNPTKYLVGDDSKSEAKNLNFFVEKGQYLTVYAESIDPANALTLDAELIVEEIV